MTKKLVWDFNAEYDAKMKSDYKVREGAGCHAATFGKVQT